MTVYQSLFVIQDILHCIVDTFSFFKFTPIKFILLSLINILSIAFKNLGLWNCKYSIRVEFVYHHLISTSNHITCFDSLSQVILDTLRNRNEGNTQLVLREAIPTEVVLYILWSILMEMKISVSFKNSPQLVCLILNTYYYYCNRCTKSVNVLRNAYIL